jgi:acyl-CoA thioester hydrolase
MTDQMGVVYYANYLEMFEIGRTDLLRATGLTYRQMEQDGYFLPVIHAACDYLAPARYDDLLEIRTTIGRLSRVRIDFDYEVRRAESGELLCRGVTRHAIVGAGGRPRRLDEAWMARLQGTQPPMNTDSDDPSVS